MKKVKNLVLGGLQQKIFNLVLFTILFVIIAYSAVAVWQSRSSRELVSETSEQQKQVLTDISRETVEEILGLTVTRTTGLEAYIADDVFNDLEATVSTIASCAEKVLSDPRSVRAQDVSAPDPADEGTVQVQLLLEEGKDARSLKMAKQIGLFGSLSGTLRAVFENLDEAGSCFIASPDGFALIADEHPAYKVGEDGEPITFPVTERPWYTGAAKSGGVYFTGLENDSFSDRQGIVCAVPVYVDGELAAVAGADLFLGDMNSAMEDLQTDSGFVCTLDKEGKVIFSPKTEGAFKAVREDEEGSLCDGNPEIEKLLALAAGGSTDPVPVTVDGVDYYISAAPIGSVGWTLITVVEADALLAPGRTLVESCDEIVAEAEKKSADNAAGSLRTIILLLVIIMILALSGSLIVAGRIVKPLNRMAKRASNISRMDAAFEMEDEYRTGDEIEVLAESVADLSLRIRNYISEITTITAEKERISTELELANRIQANMLPSIFPPFPDRKDIDIYASMTPAKEVGGDFYDFFLIDDDHLAIVMADVAGKGVPAALFMMMSKILVNNTALTIESPGAVLGQVNNQICSNNEERMFVTVWLGILTISTGEVRCSNAGHEYPMLKKADGGFELFIAKHGLPLGIKEDIVYQERTLQLERGGALFIYTDGIAEAANAEEELFGTQRMLEVLNSDKDADAKLLLKNMKDAVEEFVGDEPQFDDMTMLALKLR